MCMIAARKIINVIFRVGNRPPFTIYLQKTYKKSEVDVELSTSSTSYDVCTANIFAQLSPTYIIIVIYYNICCFQFTKALAKVETRFPDVF